MESRRAARFGRRAWIVASLTLLAAATSYGIVDRVRRPRPVPALGTSTETILTGVHMLRGLGPSVAYVVETSAGPILVDSGLEADAAPVKAEMAKLLLDWRTVKAILLTHVHGDHLGGAEHLRTATGAKVYAGRGDAGVIREGTSRDAVFSAFHMPNHAPHKTTVDVELDGGEELVFGDTTIRVIATPGHTPGSVCYLLERGGRRVLFSGDVIMHLGLETPLGTYSAYLAPRHRGDAATSLTTLRNLRAMAAPDLVLPGHPPLGPKSDDPHMAQSRWNAMMDRGIGDMETLLVRYAADGPDFIDGVPKTLLPGLHYLGDLGGVSVYAVAQGSTLLLVDAPGGAGLTDFVKERLRGLKVTPEIPTAVLLTSCDPDHIAGLKGLVAKTGAEVVASRAGLDTLKTFCPPGTQLVAAEGFSGRGPIEVKAIPLKGRGLATAAYVLKVASKTVLLSGGIPVKFGEEAMSEFASAPPPPREATIDTLESLRELEELAPDLWLPSRPWHGQNANLYGHEWKDVVATNYRAESFRLRRAPASPPTPVADRNRTPKRATDESSPQE